MKSFLFRLAMAWHCLRARRVIVLLPFHKGSESVCDARIHNAPGPIVWESILGWAAMRHELAVAAANERLLADLAEVEKEAARIDAERAQVAAGTRTTRQSAALLAEAQQLIKPKAKP